mgnify:CR=1 FL=1
MNKVLIFLIVIIISAYPQSLKTKIDNILKDKYFKRCLVAMQVEDITTNRILYKKNGWDPG